MTTLLTILDGWGHSTKQAYNPLHEARTPYIDQLFASHPSCLIEASGSVVGLPDHQMGNSEVGHLHLGAGRLIQQELTKINHEVASGQFSRNPVLQQAIARSQQLGTTLHIVGLLSPGGVHSHQQHIAQLIADCQHAGVRCALHAILDGRDVPPQSAIDSLRPVQSTVASICGRFYAMDRDQRWQRTQLAIDCLTKGIAPYTEADPISAVNAAYARQETDEFIQPTLITQNAAIITPEDTVIIMNFRADRARQLVQALNDPTFSQIDRPFVLADEQLITLTDYKQGLSHQVAYPYQPIVNHLGAVVSQANKRQLRIAETEKYAHVTYFFNGGDETALPGEDRILVPSPQVSTYDLQPEMHAQQLTEQLVEAIESEQYDFIVCNYANPDMVGHTGNYQAAITSIETIDRCLEQVITALQRHNGQAIITADHGNIEQMYDQKTQQAHTAHTCNPVPLLYIGSQATLAPAHCQPSLQDVAPSILHIMGLTAPKEMTGCSLFV